MTRTTSWLVFVMLLIAAAALAGCASLFSTTVNLPPVSNEVIEYYPRQVKGYQDSYSPRHMIVLPTDEVREFKDPSAADHQPDAQGDPMIGVVLGRDGKVLERVYGPPLGPIVQKALAASASEAGLVASVANESLDAALMRTDLNYVMASKLTRCWVKKQRGADTRYGPTWMTSAQFAVQVAIYKPPFRTPFWQGISESAYDDPPLSSFVAGPEDNTSIYDEPGQVLSVALTRGVAGVFRRPELRALIVEDSVLPR